MIIKAAWLVDVYNASTQKGYKGLMHFVELWAKIEKPVSADLRQQYKQSFPEMKLSGRFSCRLIDCYTKGE